MMKNEIIKPTKKGPVVAWNLATNEEIYFSAGTPPEYVVAYGYYVESMDMASWFFGTVHTAIEQKRTIPLWLEKAPIIRGRISIGCGDWATRV